MQKTVDLRVAPSQHLVGTTRVAGDKSISHRSIMLGSIADGTSRISGFLEAEDAMVTVNAFRSMGVSIQGPFDGEVTVSGVGLRGLSKPQGVVDLGNSGTSMRLLCGLLAGQEFDSILTGDSSLLSRPMLRVTEPLALMGACVETSTDGTAPLKISGNKVLRGIRYVMPVASAQVKSSLLLAAIYASGQTTVSEPSATRDHTERMLNGFSYPVENKPSCVAIQGGSKLKATQIDIPGDLSSAAFFIVGACIAPGSSLELKHIGVNPTRSGILNILRLMGARIETKNQLVVGGEPVADITIQSAPLTGIDIPPELVPLAIDEFPAIFIAAACAEGETRLHGASELRVKESDRIKVMAEGLNRLGIYANPSEDGMLIKGGQFSGGSIETCGDHRIAMAFAMAGLRSDEPITIIDTENINTSFPQFAEVALKLGLKIEVLAD